MKANPLAKDYGYLTPEERFRLIMAADGRGDDAETERLVRAGGRLTLSMSDHAPYMFAFEQLQLRTFLELLEEANGYIESLTRVKDAGNEANGQADETGAAESADEHADDRLEQLLDGALAAGFLLRAKANGWTQFCEQMQVPPFLQWESLAGFGRLKRALALAEDIAFTAEEFLKWLNRLRSMSAQKLTGVSAEEVAAEYEEVFRDGVRWWTG